MEEQPLVVNLLNERFSENSISVYLLLSEAWYESITCSVNIHVDPPLLFLHERICSGQERICTNHLRSLWIFLSKGSYQSISDSVHGGYSLITGFDVKWGVFLAQEFLP